MSSQSVSPDAFSGSRRPHRPIESDAGFGASQETDGVEARRGVEAHVSCSTFRRTPFQFFERILRASILTERPEKYLKEIGDTMPKVQACSELCSTTEEEKLWQGRVTTDPILK